MLVAFFGWGLCLDVGLREASTVGLSVAKSGNNGCRVVFSYSFRGAFRNLFYTYFFQFARGVLVIRIGPLLCT